MLEMVKGPARAGVLVACSLTAVVPPAAAQQPPSANEIRVGRAHELMRQHRYFDAQAVVDSVLRRSPKDRNALLARAQLLIQAWRLRAADSVAAIFPQDAAALVLRG